MNYKISTLKHKPIIGFILIWLLIFASSCSNLAQESAPTIIPTEYLPTAIALTLSADGVQVAPQITQPSPLVNDKASPIPDEHASPPPTRTETMAATPTDAQTKPAQSTRLVSTQAPTPDLITPSIPTHTPVPVIPEARVQIFRYGERSLATSPIQVYARLTSRVGKTARIELYGEDGRLLARQVKVYNQLPWHVATLLLDLDFEIKAAAEAGRLVISVEDIYGRLIDLNSVNLILLSSGVTELNPATALYERVVIHEPTPNSLIQGGVLIVTGLAQTNSNQPIRISLIGEDGQILGGRLAGVNVLTPGDYGEFFAEVSYVVEDITPALLVIYEENENTQEKTYLTSIEIVLSP
jgi:hypothetical protein